MKHTGLHVWRFDTNPSERVFAEAWDLLVERGGRPFFVATLAERPLNTLAQWLGSPVGLLWVRGLLEGPRTERAFIAAWDYFNIIYFYGLSHLDYLLGNTSDRETTRNRTAKMAHDFVRWLAGPGYDWLVETYKRACWISRDESVEGFVLESVEGFVLEDLIFPAFALVKYGQTVAIFLNEEEALKAKTDPLHDVKRITVVKVQEDLIEVRGDITRDGVFTQNEYERLRQAGLAKLSAAEKKVLGLHRLG